MTSLAAQIRQPDEIIIVDDASTDGGPEAIAAWGLANLRILRRPSPGPGGYAARNLGVETAGSEWIAFLDADDAWRPDALAEAERLIGLADGEVSCVFTRFERDYGDRIEVSRAMGRLAESDHTRLDLADLIGAWLASGQSPMWTSAVVARRSSLIASGLFPAGRCNRGGDKDTWLRLLNQGDALCSGRVTAVYHRDAVNMVTRQTGADQRPCLCGTLETLLPRLAPALRRKVERLINLEMAAHAREAWRHRQRIPPDLYRGFRVARAPLTFGLIRSAATAPEGLLRISYGLRTLIQRRPG